MQAARLSRRAVLRGLGTSIALPWLEAMTPPGGCAPASAPLRMAILYAPNGAHMADWTPADDGLKLSPILEPLAGIESEILVVTGLALDPARAQGDGGGDHARAMASFLTGRHPRKTDGADLRAGISLDQLAAQAIGQTTRFPSLELGCEGGRSAGECDHGYSCAYQSNLSWRSESTPVAKEINPRLVFDRLFGSPQGDDDARATRRRKSVLDHVLAESTRLRRTLSTADRRKLDEYLTGVRELERRIASTQPALQTGSMPRPLGIPADYQEHLRLLADLLVLALQTDSTRIATFVFGNDGSNRTYPSLGVSDGHHDLSHHGGDPIKQARIRTINRFHVAQFAYLLRRLREVREGPGTLLDHCMILYGSGISDGNRHTHENLPVLLAGKANGTIRTGRHLRLRTETPITNLYLAMLDRLGVACERFGDSTGSFEGL